MTTKSKKPTSKEKILEEKVLTVPLEEFDEKTIQDLNHSHLSVLLAAIMRDERAGKDLTDIVLKGGTVKAGVTGNGDVMWQKTVWRRSGPLVVGEELINPADLRIPTSRVTKR